jgi:hypothetical protein
MRRVVLISLALLTLSMVHAASAKLPFFGLAVDPVRPRIGEPITLTMSCYEDMAHTRSWGSCLGTDGPMAWVHPLDDEGQLDRDDWIMVEGHPTSSGATRGQITLDEAGAYDVLPLWRTWRSDHSDGFPGVVRIEVGLGGRIVPIAVASVGVVAFGLMVYREGVESRSRTSPGNSRRVAVCAGHEDADPFAIGWLIPA